MYLPNDLLQQAKELAHQEQRGAPRQVNLRRAISASYYALFHLLIDCAVEFCSPAEPPKLRARIRRAFEHGKMKTVCRIVSSGGRLPSSLAALIAPQQAFSTDVRRLATTFIQLQDARHRADYDLEAKLTRSEVEQIIAAAHDAYDALQRVRKTEEGAIFLSALLLHDKWDR